jgi:hypothetical protein
MISKSRGFLGSRSASPELGSSLFGFADAVAVGVRFAASPASAVIGPMVGRGENAFDQARPPASVAGSGTTATSTGRFHSCAIHAGSGGTVVCWGFDQYGEATPPLLVNESAGSP